MLELYGMMLQATPIVPPGPRAEENKAPPSAELKEAFSSVFVDSFTPATMKTAGTNWSTEFGKCLETRHVQEGVFWDMVNEPPPADLPIRKSNYTVEKDPKRIELAHKAIDKEIRQLEADGRIKKVDPEDINDAAMILPVFAVFQGDKIRLVWDARALNQHIECKTFRMETIKEAAKLVRPGDYLFTVSNRQCHCTPSCT